MRSPWIRLGLIPALILLPLTLVRMWLELNHPDASGMRLLSVFALSLAWLVIAGVMLARARAPFARVFWTVATFSVVVRLPLAVIYALAWQQHWTTPDGTPVRYIRDLTDQFGMPPDTSTAVVLTLGFLAPVAEHLIVGLLAWAIAAAIVRRRAAA